MFQRCKDLDKLGDKQMECFTDIMNLLVDLILVEQSLRTQRLSTMCFRVLRRNYNRLCYEFRVSRFNCDNKPAHKVFY